MNYLPFLENDDLPFRLHLFHVVSRVNHHSRNRVNSSLQVVGGWTPVLHGVVSPEEVGAGGFHARPFEGVFNVNF